MIGIAIRLARKTLGISASDLVLRAGIARSHLWRLENRRERPGYDILCRLARACSMPASQLCRIAESLEAGEALPGLAARFGHAILDDSTGAGATSSIKLATTTPAGRHHHARYEHADGL